MSEQNGTIQAAIAEIIEPLRDQLAGLDQELAEVEERRQELLASRRQVWNVIRAADPNAAPKKPGPKQGPKSERLFGNANFRRAAEMIEKYLRDHPEAPSQWRDGITRTALNREIQGISPPTIDGGLELLVEGGFLRFDRKARGGGKAYAVVGQ